MSLFTSDRERRLWLWTLAVMVAIYSTLGPARTLVDALRERNLLRLSFAVVVAVLVVAIAWRWAKQRPSWSEIGVGLGVAFAYLVMFVRTGSPEERTHLIEYGIVAALIHQALQERVRNGRRVPAPAALTVALTALLGILDECIQAMLPNRAFDFRDIFFNALAGFMVVVARLALAPQRRPGWRIWFFWLLGSAVGWGLGMEVSSFFLAGGLRSLRSSPDIILAGYLGVAVGGILAGSMQALVLRGHLARAGRWVLTSLGAAAVVGLIVFGVGAVNADIGWVAGASLYGTSVGALQWTLLRGQVPRAGWWVVACTVGWIVGMPLGGMFGWMALGAAYGAITGTALVWLLNKRG
jgi:hypothetical protein